ncbi:venom serine protease 34-like [Ceratina calcarata]|uniref:Venom serine protease 34-like n=1 Tax=Ceratina calcarata TaxID=156304 RepID=A0AAJ7IVT5_9HYME|nr:venom serine protease 34-like [Ceratina calcarata]
MTIQNDLSGITARAAFLLICWFAVASAQTPNSNQLCDYFQNLELNNTYYIYNTQYPNRYRGRQSCTWTMKSDYRVNLTCTVEMPWSSNCSQDMLTVQINPSTTKRYCGDGPFSVLSDSNTMVVSLQTPFWSTGGRFLCQAQAVENPRETENCRCGWRNPSRIVGGTDAGVNEFPMMAGIVDSLEADIFCGATIIAKKYVVTAGHCLENRDTSTLAIVVGEHDVTTGADTNATQLFRIRRVIFHPNYVTGGQLNDIAVVEIQGEINYGVKVGPVCLPFQHSQDSFGGDHVNVLGWGLTEFGGPKATVLQKVVLSVITNLMCSRSYPQISTEQLCTYAPGKDSCQMDSGGPVLWQNPTTQNLVLIAAISNGRGCGEDAGVNERIGAHIDWIVSVTPDATYCAVE